MSVNKIEIFEDKSISARELLADYAYTYELFNWLLDRDKRKNK